MLNKIFQKEKIGRCIKGFTLIELVMTIVIMGFLSMILIPFFNSIVHSPDPMIRQQAVALGHALMDEILTKKWDDNTPVGGGPLCTGESWTGSTRAGVVLDCTTWPQASNIAAEEGSRANFDDVDDYNNYSETNVFFDQTITSSVTLNGFTRSASVDYITSNSDPINKNTATAGNSGGNSATDSKRIIVTVTSPLEENTYTFVAVSCNI